MTSSSESPAARAVPDFFLVGLPKSGTTAMYEMLRRHPQVFMPVLKEPRFFDSDLRALFEPVRTGRLPDTLDQYLALFDPAEPGQLLGEASPSYLRSEVAAAAIAQVAPGARIVSILREPAGFVRSLHLQLLQENVQVEQDLRRSFEAERIERQGRTVLRYSDHIHYVEQLLRYASVFPPEQILTLIYDDFRTDNEGAVRGVLRFLGIDDTVPIEAVQANPTVAVRSQRLDQAVRRISTGRGPLARPAKSLAKAVMAGLPGERAQAVRQRLLYSAPPAPDQEFMLELRRRFAPEVSALSDYLGRDLVTLWGYDELG